MFTGNTSAVLAIVGVNESLAAQWARAAMMWTKFYAFIFVLLNFYYCKNINMKILFCLRNEEVINILNIRWRLNNVIILNHKKMIQTSKCNNLVQNEY